jgi:hypothetical protein
VLDWTAYYEVLKQSVAPPLPLPGALVDDLRIRIPPRQVVLAHPSYSCALVVLIDGYCFNPERIYGHYFQPAVRYHASYVVRRGREAPEHPFFNANPSLTDAEARVLADYGVSYVLADPGHAEPIAEKLRQAGVTAIVEVEREGYRLYRLDPHTLRRAPASAGSTGALSQNTSPSRLATSR